MAAPTSELFRLNVCTTGGSVVHLYKYSVVILVQWFFFLHSSQQLHFHLTLFSVILQVNFNPSPQTTRSTPSSSPPTWSSRDIKRSSRRHQATWNSPVSPAQGNNRRRAPRTRKTTETDEERKHNLRHSELYWLHWEGKGSKLESVAMAETCCRSCACLFIDVVYWVLLFSILVPYRDLKKLLPKSLHNKCLMARGWCCLYRLCACVLAYMSVCVYVCVCVCVYFTCPIRKKMNS